jgi:DNA-3-methyladenine glycosylase II
MLLTATPQTIAAGIQHLQSADPTLAGLIAAHPPYTKMPHTNYYHSLVRAIIGQQLSVKAAAAIEGRFKALFDNTFPSPEQILTVSADQLREIGFSYAKAGYVHDLAVKILDGTVQFDHLDTLENDAIITELTQVKGIGEWTAHMFLMSCMGRLDVLPVGDLGIRVGVQKLYGLDQPATPAEVTLIAQHNNWHPYESIASWYIWQSLNNAP